jgi:dihydroorotase
MIRPDDWHLHLRDGQALKTTVAHTTAQFARAIVMPNLATPIAHTRQALDYKKRILNAIPKGATFEPLMTLYLTQNTSPAEIIAAKSKGIIACKLYPAGATTNSDSGVTDLRGLYPVFEEMEVNGILLLLHGESTDSSIDIFDREAQFIDKTLIGLRKTFPNLKMVLEHISTKEAVEFVTESDSYLAATITAHHLLYNRNALFQGGLRPHHYCLPILKREIHRQALLKAATSGNIKFFLGTDSAPHTVDTKENACGCAGCYTAPIALELYATAFSEVGALHRLEGFSSFYGADFYGLPRNTSTIKFTRKKWTIPLQYTLGYGQVRPLKAGEALEWKVG